ncbi:VWA domain-containing protein [Mycobacterium talmoniae]|uniref:VWFA domain-containing protein n=1 Tax=Mycobacterium talmoniae TaxID=1858794 RepID=A0A1S1NHE4_9MYCO|nr:VWA domain-containing protein [Mycobacterium talmoniae]OHV03393.1 hypothetical protein BKN37_15205 [Mycobacterium talmoniae]
MIDVPEPLQRWRLLLGAAADGALGRPDGELAAADAALDWLYGRDPDRIERGERIGGDGESTLTVPEWIDTVHRLFPQEVIERVERDAVERFGITEIVTRLDVLERIEPSESLLRAVLQTKHLMNPEVLAAARHLVGEVVRRLLAELQTEVRRAFSGVLDRRRRSPVPVARNFDFRGTVKTNLDRWDPRRQRLYLQRPLFLSRTQRHTERWRIVLLVDQSGSMVDSVIHSAVLASCLWQLPGMDTSLAAFDTSVVDLTSEVTDPVELLMKVQLGGGTDIAAAVGWAQQRLASPHRSIVVVISDFFEGGSARLLVRRVKELVAGGTTVLGLAALDRDANPSYNRELAAELVAAGAEVAAMTPGELASWLAEQVRR